MQHRHELMPVGLRLPGTTELVVLVVATLLMLGGAILMLTEAMSAGIAIPLIAVGIALVVIASWPSAEDAEKTEARAGRNCGSAP